jgi:hypothetical protein
MSSGGCRARAGEYVGRVKAAAELLGDGVSVSETARMLAQRFGCSVRQARRYVQRAAVGGQVVVPEAMTVFTVKLPVALVARVRERAAASGSTISTLVAQALREFLARGNRERPGW